MPDADSAQVWKAPAATCCQPLPLVCASADCGAANQTAKPATTANAAAGSARPIQRLSICAIPLPLRAASMRAAAGSCGSAAA